MEKPRVTYTSDESSHGRNGPTHQTPPVTADPQAEATLLRKLDFAVVPILFLLFFFAFLDRINIGNAKVQGLDTDLRLEGNQFNIALLIFFVPYIVFEVPSNIALKRLSPSTWLSVLTFGVGVSSMCQGLVKSYAGLAACRFFIGFFEAGLLPGCVYLMSMYYKRAELQRRFSIFFAAGFIAGSFGGLLAFALAKLDEVGGYAGWRWIFIIEGLLTITVSFFSKCLIPDWPAQARFLDVAERTLLRARLDLDASSARMDELNGRALRLILGDWKIWIGALVYFSVTISGYATALFIPTILNEFGYTPSASQVHSIPIWMAALVITIATAWASDRTGHRWAFIMFGCTMASAGYVVLLCQGPPHGHGGLSIGTKYAALFVVTIGVYMVQPLTIVWLMNNLGGHHKRAWGSAIQIGVGNMGGVVASNIFVASGAPRFFVGYAVALAFMILCAILSTVFMLGLTRENRKRDLGQVDERFELPQAELDNMGDGHPDFKFIR